eukprot:443416_1
MSWFFSSALDRSYHNHNDNWIQITNGKEWVLMVHVKQGNRIYDIGVSLKYDEKCNNLFYLKSIYLDKSNVQFVEEFEFQEGSALSLQTDWNDDDDDDDYDYDTDNEDNKAIKVSSDFGNSVESTIESSYEALKLKNDAITNALKLLKEMEKQMEWYKEAYESEKLKNEAITNALKPSVSKMNDIDIGYDHVTHIHSTSKFNLAISKMYDIHVCNVDESFRAEEKQDIITAKQLTPQETDQQLEDTRLIKELEQIAEAWDVKNISTFDCEKLINENFDIKSSQIIRINVRQTTGKHIQLNIDSNDTVTTLKRQIQLELGFAPNRHRLIFDDKILDDENTLNYYNISNNATIYLVLILSGGCFTGDTKVLLSTMQQMDIRDINVGDEVLTFNLHKHQLESHYVKKILKYKVNELVKIKFDNHLPIKCTASHPFYVPEKRNWCCIKPMNKNTEYGKLSIDDNVIDCKLQLIRIADIEYEYINDGDYVTVYTLHLDTIHNFYANGILVHNAMQIFIKSSADKAHILDVEPNDTIKMVKSKLEDQSHISIKHQRLFMGKIQLEDDKTLNYYNIQKEATLQLRLTFDQFEEKKQREFKHSNVFGSDVNMHINKKLTTKVIPKEARESFLDIFTHMKTFAMVHGNTAIRKFRNNETWFRIINFDLHSKQGELLYVIMEMKSEWKMDGRLYTKQQILERFSGNESVQKLPQIIRLKSRYQSQVNMKNTLINLLLNGNQSENIIKTTKWNSSKRIPIVNVRNKYSFYVALSKCEFERRILKFTNTKSVHLVPRSNGASYRVEYVWIVNLDINIHIGLLLKLNKHKSLSVEISGIYTNINDQHRLIPHENNCQCLNNVNMCLTGIIIENDHENRIHKLEQQLNRIKNKNNQHEQQTQLHNNKLDKINNYYFTQSLNPSTRLAPQQMPQMNTNCNTSNLSVTSYNDQSGTIQALQQELNNALARENMIVKMLTNSCLMNQP